MSSGRPPGAARAERFRQELKARGFELLDQGDAATLTAAPASTTVRVSAARLHPFDMPGHGRLHVLVPVNLTVHLGADGGVAEVDGGDLSTDDLQAARMSLGDIIANGRLEDPMSHVREPAATHVVVTEADGRRVVRRVGFDASAPGRG